MSMPARAGRLREARAADAPDTDRFVTVVPPETEEAKRLAAVMFAIQVGQPAYGGADRGREDGRGTPDPTGGPYPTRFGRDRGRIL